MKVDITLTVRSLKDAKEAIQVLSQYLGGGSSDNQPKDAGVKEAGNPVAYEPSNDRTKLALAALLKCERVQLARPAILESWSAAFPHVDLAGEIAKAEAWAQSKDVKRSPKGWAKALNSWLGKAQDKARGGFPSPALPTGHPAIARALEKVDPAVDAWAKAAE
jgi:hypothetical protein